MAFNSIFDYLLSHLSFFLIFLYLSLIWAVLVLHSPGEKKYLETNKIWQNLNQLCKPFKQNQIPQQGTLFMHFRILTLAYMDLFCLMLMTVYSLIFSQHRYIFCFKLKTL